MPANLLVGLFQITNPVIVFFVLSGFASRRPLEQETSTCVAAYESIACPGSAHMRRRGGLADGWRDTRLVRVMPSSAPWGRWWLYRYAKASTKGSSSSRRSRQEPLQRSTASLS